LTWIGAIAKVPAYEYPPIREDISAMTTASAPTATGIPMPIVTANRVVIVTTLLVAFVTQQPWLTTLLLVVLLGSVLVGPKGSVVYQGASRLMASRVAAARAAGDIEDRRLMRFNNTIAVLMLAAAQVAFLAGSSALGWIFCGVVVLAASVALAGFCVGCFLFYRLRLLQYRWRTDGA
jgi:membrane associated rhomboid family serine protease